MKWRQYGDTEEQLGRTTICDKMVWKIDAFKYTHLLFPLFSSTSYHSYRHHRLLQKNGLKSQEKITSTFFFLVVGVSYGAVLHGCFLYLIPYNQTYIFWNSGCYPKNENNFFLSIGKIFIFIKQQKHIHFQVSHNNVCD